MPMYVGLVRGINVGKSNRIKMSSLKSFLEDLGATNVRTLLQSGNFVFEGGRRTGRAWKSLMRDQAKETLGIDVAFYVRTATEWNEIVNENPFPKMAQSDPAHLLALVLDNVPVVRLDYDGPEEVMAGKHAIYATFPEGAGRSRLIANAQWKKMTAKGTARNWNTVLKLQAMLDE